MSKLEKWKIKHKSSSLLICRLQYNEQQACRLQHHFWTQTKADELLALGCIIPHMATLNHFKSGVPNSFTPLFRVTSDCKLLCCPVLKSCSTDFHCSEDSDSKKLQYLSCIPVLGNAGLSPVTPSWGNSTAGDETAEGSVKPLTGSRFYTLSHSNVQSVKSQTLI